MRGRFAAPAIPASCGPDPWIPCRITPTVRFRSVCTARGLISVSCFLSSVLGPGMEPFMRKRPPGRHTDCQPIARSLGAVCWLTGRMAPGSVHSQKALSGKTRKENDFTYSKRKGCTVEKYTKEKGIFHAAPACKETAGRKRQERPPEDHSR